MKRSPIFDFPCGNSNTTARRRESFSTFLWSLVSTYRRPLLSQPGGAVEGVAGLQDGHLGGVEALPLLGGGDDALDVLLHAGHRAALDAAAAGGGAGGPGAALPPDRTTVK